MKKPLGIYIHVPFCKSKCAYCDFYSFAPCGDIIDRYVAALCEHIKRLSEKAVEYSVDSIFIGGGTPTVLGGENIAVIGKALSSCFDIADGAEFTVEANPGTVKLDDFAAMREAEVNRVSFGLQSVHENELRALSRIHTFDDFLKAYGDARAAGIDNINIDLMFAIPGLGVRTWRRTVKAALKLNPTHISFYSLEIAEGTEFYRRLKNFEMKETLPIIDRFMYHNAIDIMEKKGFVHYEISNMALPGKECLHNLKYWNFEEYLGLGASSHGFVRGVRYSNVSDIKEYIKALRGQDFSSDNTLGASKAYGAYCVDTYHINTFEDNVSEFVFTALRTQKGVVFEEFKRKIKNDFWDVFGSERMEFEKYVKEGYAISDSHHIALTREGMDISNRIMAIFV